MILVRLSDRYLNLDRVIQAEVLREKDGQPALRLVFAVRGTDGAPYSVTLRGDEARVVLDLLQVWANAGKPVIRRLESLEVAR